MIQGTMSNAGKSLIAAGLCRIFRQDGYRVAPFKSQNMALNSYITEDGYEMGRAQAVQAFACGIRPDVRMNPILLKPTSNIGSQVIVMGKSVGNMKAFDYYRKKTDYIPVIRDAYNSLAADNDIIVIEGAGSPVEINLKDNDIVNMGMAEIADASVLLVGDIDRGGVFAQLLGTMELLEEDEKQRIKGLVINKFRGDVSILEPGLKMLEEKCKRPVVSVMPYCDVKIEDEDSLAPELEECNKGRIDGVIDIAVIRLKWISNFTDTDALRREEDVSVRYVDDVYRLGNPDMIIIPGSKNTIADMDFLNKSGLAAAIRRLADRGTVVMGICGGYQIMGRSIRDSVGAEGGGSIQGLSLLPVDTVFEEEKVTAQVSGHIAAPGHPFEALADIPVSGYEIHMGRSCIYDDTEKKGVPFGLVNITNANEPLEDGCVSGNCMGTYIHGIFDEPDFKNALLSVLYANKGLERKKGNPVSYNRFRDEQFDMLAGIMRANMDMKAIYGMIDKE